MTTNREKMIAGYDYDASDPELVQAHLDCLHRLAEINDQNLLDIHQRHTLYSNLLRASENHLSSTHFGAIMASISPSVTGASSTSTPYFLTLPPSR